MRYFADVIIAILLPSFSYFLGDLFVQQKLMFLLGRSSKDNQTKSPVIN